MILEPDGNGGFSLETYDWQRRMLSNLIPSLRELLVEGSSPILRRLYPTAYPNDVEANSAFEELVHDQLLEQKLAALDTVESTIESQSLTEEELVGWMNAINSLRLVLGTRLDISEEDDPLSVPEDDPDRPLWVSYELLTQMLGLVVDVLSEG